MQTNTQLELIITSITQLTSCIRSYQLRAQNQSELPLINAGSHLTIEIRSADNKIETHYFSICSNPNQRDFYEIALLQEDNNPDSKRLIEHLTVGMIISSAMPANNFHLHADASPAILIASGIGITAIKPIAQTLVLRGRRFSLHYAGSSLDEMAFEQELQTIMPRELQLYPADKEKHLDIMQILADAPSNAIFYACAPQKILNDIETSARLLGIDADRIQCEYFHTEKAAQDKPVILELAYSDKLIQVGADQPLLAALRTAGVDVNFDCCVGDCGTCAIKVLEGEPEHRDHVLSDEQKAQGFICVCVSRTKGDKLVLAL